MILHGIMFLIVYYVYFYLTVTSVFICKFIFILLWHIQ